MDREKLKKKYNKNSYVERFLYAPKHEETRNYPLLILLIISVITSIISAGILIIYFYNSSSTETPTDSIFTAIRAYLSLYFIIIVVVFIILMSVLVWWIYIYLVCTVLAYFDLIRFIKQKKITFLTIKIIVSNFLLSAFLYWLIKSIIFVNKWG